jgi:hypothetical protein
VSRPGQGRGLDRRLQPAPAALRAGHEVAGRLRAHHGHRGGGLMMRPLPCHRVSAGARRRPGRSSPGPCGPAGAPPNGHMSSPPLGSTRAPSSLSRPRRLLIGTTPAPPCAGALDEDRRIPGTRRPAQAFRRRGTTMPVTRQAGPGRGARRRGPAPNTRGGDPCGQTQDLAPRWCDTSAGPAGWAVRAGMGGCGPSHPQDQTPHPAGSLRVLARTGTLRAAEVTNG